MRVPIVGGIGLAIFASTFSIFGGLKAVVWTDVVQVAVLIFGGLLASVLVLSALGGGFFEGLQALLKEAPEKFDLILLCFGVKLFVQAIRITYRIDSE